MSANPLVDEWVSKAENNYMAAIALAQDHRNPVADVVCNQCQQCAEKYLKGFLVQKGIKFPKVHDMEQLEDLVAQIEPAIRHLHNEMKLLAPYGVDVKYPGLPVAENEAKDAIKA